MEERGPVNKMSRENTFPGEHESDSCPSVSFREASFVQNLDGEGRGGGGRAGKEVFRDPQGGTREVKGWVRKRKKGRSGGGMGEARRKGMVRLKVKGKWGAGGGGGSGLKENKIEPGN